MQELEQQRRCNSISSKGKRCNARPLDGKNYCFFHQPDKEITRRAQIEGGKKGKRKPQEFIPVKYIEDLRVVLQTSIHNVKSCSGSEIAKARVIGYLTSIFLRYFEVIREIKGDAAIIECTEPPKKKGWMEETFKSFPSDIRDRLIAALNEKRQQSLVWFAGELQKAEQEVNERKNDRIVPDKDNIMS